MALYKKNLAKLIREVKKDISDEYRAFYEDETPGIQLTIGYNPETKEWSFQTGDNSFTGGAYHYPVWGVAGIYRNSNSRDVATEIYNEIFEQIEEV